MSRVVSSLPRTPRALAFVTIAAILALSVMIVSKSPIEGRAAGSSGSPFAWGDNYYGELGNGTTTGSSTPVAVSWFGSPVTAVAGGRGHSLALNSLGQVLAWGANGAGQLGNGNTTGTTTPQNSFFSVTATAVAAGDDHSLVLTSAGQVMAAGNNGIGQLGNGSTTNSSSPVAVMLPNGTTITAIAADGANSLALTSTGRVLAWGDNTYGQLGNGTTANSTIPVQVTLPITTSITAIAAGTSHSLALASNGQIWAWGGDFYGQLGDGITPNISTVPVAVHLPVGTTATSIAGGGNSSHAITSTGQALTWGVNSHGELGNGTIGTTGCFCSATPTFVSLPSGTTVTTMAGGSDHSLALTSAGKVLAWGSNGLGQLGNGTTTDSSTPITVSGLPAFATAIAAGTYHSLAILPPAVAVMPAMTNGAYGGYVTAATITNAGTAPASIHIAYYNQSGAAVGAGDTLNNLPVNASWTVRQDDGNSFPSSGGDAVQAGSAVVYSSQPIASFVNEFAPGNVGDATSYTGVLVPFGVGATLYAPTIVNNAYGGYTTGIGLLNEGSVPTDVTITYRGADGSVVKTQTVPGLAAHAYRALYSGDTSLALPSGFAGTATISSSGQPLGAVVNETGPGGQFSSYDAVPSGTTWLSAPVALNNAFGGYYTGIAIQNTSASADTVQVRYYDASGTATVKSFTIPGYGSLGVYQGSPTDGPAVGAYTAVIQSTNFALDAGLVVIVNEVAPSTTSAKQSTSYNTFGAVTLHPRHLALVENAGSDPWNTGLGIMNTGNTTTVTVNYYDSVTGAPVGTPQTHTLAPQAFWGVYQPTGGLPSGTRATAVVTTAGQVVVICNESSSTTFMSYDGQPI